MPSPNLPEREGGAAELIETATTEKQHDSWFTCLYAHCMATIVRALINPGPSGNST